jgi:hypothetical protein
MLAESSNHAAIVIGITRNVFIFSVGVEEDLIDEFHCEERWRWRSE